jgi:hypothetical protein
MELIKNYKGIPSNNHARYVKLQSMIREYDKMHHLQMALKERILSLAKEIDIELKG